MKSVEVLQSDGSSLDVCSYVWFLHSCVKDDPSETLSCVNTQFLRGLLTLGELLQKTKVSGRVMSPQHVYHMYVV